MLSSGSVTRWDRPYPAGIVRSDTEIATTSRYAHVTKDDLRAGMEAASPTKNITKKKRAGGKALE